MPAKVHNLLYRRNLPRLVPPPSPLVATPSTPVSARYIGRHSFSRPNIHPHSFSAPAYPSTAPQRDHKRRP